MVIVYNCFNEVIVFKWRTTNPPPSTVSMVLANRFGVIAQNLARRTFRMCFREFFMWFFVITKSITQSERQEGRMKDTHVYRISVTVTNISKDFCSFASLTPRLMSLLIFASRSSMTTGCGQQKIPNPNTKKIRPGKTQLLFVTP